MTTLFLIKRTLIILQDYKNYCFIKIPLQHSSINVYLMYWIKNIDFQKKYTIYVNM